MIESENLRTYLSTLHGQDEGLLADIVHLTHKYFPEGAHMLTGRQQGRLLSMLSTLTQPRRILEVGTFTGYSALCLAEGLADGGELITIDRDIRLKKHLEPIFEKASIAVPNQNASLQIIYRQGDAMEQIAATEGVFDLVFIDADKRRYQDYLDAIMPKMRQGSLLLLDNVLWKGRVYEADPMDNKGRPDAIAAYLKGFNESLARNTRLDAVMLALRDGLWVCRVK